jgi:hypothetical protein
MLAYPGLIGADPESSRIYVKGAHEGPALTPTQAPVISDWIVTYNAHKPKSTGLTDAGMPIPTITPFAPAMGANTVDLSVLDPALAGQTITFTAKMLGTTQVELSQIKVKAATGMGVHMVHPLWVTWDAKMAATPDPIDSFATLDETVYSADTQPMGPGTVVLPFTAGESLNVVFQTIEPKTGSADGGMTGGCKNVAGFSAVKAQLTGGAAAAPLTCSSCHGQQGNNAANAFNLVGIATAANDAQTCASVRGEVDPVTTANSLLYKKVDSASGVAHNGGKVTSIAAFKTAMDAWITTEK